MKIAVHDLLNLEKAQALANHMGIPLTLSKEAFDFVLEYHEGVLQLVDISPRAPGPLWIDFTSGAVDFRRKQGHSSSQPLYKALGLDKRLDKGMDKEIKKVLDATAGLGRDAFVLATWGCEVTAVERSPVLYQLLLDAHLRALLHAEKTQDQELKAILSRIHLIHADARSYLQNLQGAELFDAVYIDPMFPERKKAALVKKEMQYLQKLIGEDQDSLALIEVAMSKVKSRVVVKRAAGSEVLKSQPKAQYETKTTRFDIY